MASPPPLNVRDFLDRPVAYFHPACLPFYLFYQIPEQNYLYSQNTRCHLMVDKTVE